MSEIKENPYAPGVVQQKHVHSEVEAIRHAHLSHEASVKSIGLLYLIGSGMLLLAGTGYFITGIAMLNDQSREPSLAQFGAVMLAIGAFLVIYAVAQVVVAIGLRKLSPWSKIPAAVIAGIGLIFFPIGTLINGYVLYLLFSKKGTMVFSPGYKDVIFQTPHMKYKTSIVVWVLVGLLGVLFVAVIAAALFRV
jgi:hypothetical protein